MININLFKYLITLQVYRPAGECQVHFIDYQIHMFKLDIWFLYHKMISVYMA